MLVTSKLIHKSYVEQELAWLYKYLTMSDAGKGAELIRQFPWEFQSWAERKRVATPEILKDDWFYEEDFIATIPDKLKIGFFQGFHTSDPNTPLFTMADYEGLVKNSWLVHFTDNAFSIAREGFTKGVTLHEWERLGLSTHFKTHGEGFNFAFTLKDADHEGTKYGKQCVMFKASGIKIYHHGDGEHQVIFIGATATDLVPIYEGDSGWIVEGNGFKQMFKGESLSSVLNWVASNYDQFKSQLAKNPNQRLLSTPR